MTQADARPLDAALAAAEQAVTNNPDHAPAWHDLGVLYQHGGLLAQSRDAFVRAAALDASLASIHNNLGNTYMMLGDREAAVTSYRRALALDASLAAAHANAAVALHALARYEEALEHAHGAVALDPGNPTPRITSAFIAASARGPAAGLAEIEDVLATQPENVRALAARSHLLLRLDRFADALHAAQAGLVLEPNDGLLIECLGCAHRGLGNFDKAFAAFDRAIALGHDRAGMLVFRASGLLEIGEFEAAQEALTAALKLQPDLATAWHALSEVQTFAPSAETLAEMETLLAESPRLQGADARALMHFALARGYRKTGDRDAAFRHFAAGNAAKRSTITYDPATDEDLAEHIVATFTPELMATLGGAGDPSQAPIFVIGMPRSGTTLIEQILASHLDVFGAGELTLFDRAIEECGDRDVTALGRRYLELLAEFTPAGKRVVDKLPSNFRNAGLIHLALPNARIIHCTRDALDTGFSCYTTLFTGRQDFSFDLVEIGRFYRAYQRLIDHWHAVLPPGIMLDVAYADAVTDLAGTAHRLLDFCNLTWNDAVLEFHKTERVIRTASYHQARKPIYASSLHASEPYRPYLQPLIDALGPYAKQTTPDEQSRK